MIFSRLTECTAVTILPILEHFHHLQTKRFFRPIDSHSFFLPSAPHNYQSAFCLNAFERPQLQPPQHGFMGCSYAMVPRITKLFEETVQDQRDLTLFFTKQRLYDTQKQSPIIFVIFLLILISCTQSAKSFPFYGYKK